MCSSRYISPSKWPLEKRVLPRKRYELKSGSQADLLRKATTLSQHDLCSSNLARHSIPCSNPSSACSQPPRALSPCSPPSQNRGRQSTEAAVAGPPGFRRVLSTGHQAACVSPAEMARRRGGTRPCGISQEMRMIPVWLWLRLSKLGCFPNRCKAPCFRVPEWVAGFVLDSQTSLPFEQHPSAVHGVR